MSASVPGDIGSHRSGQRIRSGGPGRRAVRHHRIDADRRGAIGMRQRSPAQGSLPVCPPRSMRSVLVAGTSGREAAQRSGGSDPPDARRRAGRVDGTRPSSSRAAAIEVASIRPSTSKGRPAVSLPVPGPAPAVAVSARTCIAPNGAGGAGQVQRNSLSSAACSSTATPVSAAIAPARRRAGGRPAGPVGCSGSLDNMRLPTLHPP